MKVHSVLGLVTNSSSETYYITQEKLEDVVFDGLQAVLDGAGTGQNARDLFTVEAVSTDDWLEERNEDEPSEQVFILSAELSNYDPENLRVKGQVYVTKVDTGEVDKKLSAQAKKLLNDLGLWSE